jgi:glyoxylase-like metal-dependent hydrolase (beta-lactamase superfamily II)
MSADRLYFRQLLSGADFARDDPLAPQMVNFVYLVGDRETGEAVVIDPAYGVGELVDLLAADGLRLTGALVTHYHADHCGGDIMGYSIEGLRELLALDGGGVPVHVQRAEAEWVKRSTGVSDSDLALHDSGDVVHAGGIPIALMHTPGHTPGSQCFVVDGRLVAGDTLFLEGCGRTDFPGGSVDDMFRSLQALAKLSGDPTVFPGHWYSAEPSASLSEVKATNYVYRASSLDQWRMVMGG